jgi:hypothetical protein
VKILNLKDVQVSDKMRDTLIDMMSNLPKLNAALQDADTVDIEVIRKCIKLELATKKRPATMSRLLGRLKSLVSMEIDREVYGG